MKHPLYVNFVGMVDLKSIDHLLQTVNVAHHEGVEQLILGIASPGGRTKNAMLAHNYLISTGMKIATHNLGFVDSAAMWLFLAGSKRSAAPGSSFFIHAAAAQLSSNFYGQSALIERAMDLKNDDQLLTNVLTSRTSMKRRQVQSCLRQARRIDDKEAHDLGIIHSIEEMTLPANAKAVLVGGFRDQPST